MATIKWTNEANAWLRNLHDFIVEDNPDAARKVVQEIYGKAQLLGKFPRIGQLYRAEPEGSEEALLTTCVRNRKHVELMTCSGIPNRRQTGAVNLQITLRLCNRMTLEEA